jgi:large subunit ribosomal protein L6
MSRVGRLPIPVPSGVNIDVSDTQVTVKGPKGQLVQALVEHIDVASEAGAIQVSRRNESRQARANHGLMRSLVQNMVTGVSTGFTKQLSVIGIGYRAEIRGSKLVLNLGYSHPVEYAIPTGISITADKQNVISISGIDKQQVGQVAAEIRAWRKPDAYKGKGVRYIDERVRLKAGKSAK